MSEQVVTAWQVGWGVPGGLPVAIAIGVGLFVLAALGSRARGVASVGAGARAWTLHASRPRSGVLVRCVG